ncbi:hypothetical protein G7068_03170 [Leucobacter viscericola]|uniref:Uncharacterized protein n=1 Tax=Leucobacter viscericola TaxID=2714935 RepID=A0A6G7XCM8_9MICO|nr:hypothetical protein [Leucobacter viscericola]QIK62315.1 hypothetical protein G7068_03170 [Leucobacter viscericola]
MAIAAIDGVTPNSRATDPVTSVDAGRSVNLVHSKEYVFQALKVFGPMADHELVELHEGDTFGHKAFGRFSPQRLRTARANLVEDERVEFTGKYRKTDSGRRAQVWCVKPSEFTRDEKLARLGAWGDLTIRPSGPHVNISRLDAYLGIGDSRLTDLDADRRAAARLKTDELAAKCGSRDLIDLLFFLALREQ